MSRTNSSSASVGGFFPGQLAPSPSGVATISVTCHFPGVPVRLSLRAPRGCGPTGCYLLLRIEYQQERTTQPTTKRNLALAGGCEPLRCGFVRCWPNDLACSRADTRSVRGGVGCMPWLGSLH